MKIKLLSLFLLTFCISCAQILSNYELKCEKLKKDYDNLLKNKSSSNAQLMYFEEFPNNFYEFNLIFGYNHENTYEIDKVGCLYNESLNYIQTFFDLNFVGKEKFIKKIINISIDGKWYADGVNHFKRELKFYFKKNIDLFCELLLQENEKDIESFFYFYFDGPNEPIIPDEFILIKKNNSELYNIIEKSFHRVKNK